jgi:hypothetical protein
MKKEDIPQDPSTLAPYTKELCYAVDESGKYVTELSNGWDIKMKALDVAWEDIEERVKQARQKVLNGEASPLLYFMEKRLMDLPIVTGYTGFWGWQVKRHLRPTIFNKLSEKKLLRYVKAFNLSSIDDLKNMHLNED